MKSEEVKMNQCTVNQFITERELALCDGEDIRPITRREMYIKAIFHPEQQTPAPVTREEICLQKIVDYVNTLKEGEKNE